MDETMRNLVKRILKEANISGELEEFSLLTEGALANCYSFRVNKNNYLLKVRKDNKAWKLKQDYDLLSYLASLDVKLGPVVFYYDDSKNILDAPYLLEERVIGSHPTHGKVDEVFLQKIAEWYASLHKITFSELKFCKDEEQKMQRIHSLIYSLNYDKELINNAVRTNKLQSETKKSLELMIDLLEKLFQKHDKIFSRSVFNLIHFDPDAENIIIQPDGCLKFIDWEFGFFYIYEADLAEFAWTWNLTEAQEKDFLRFYGVKNCEETYLKFYLMQLNLILANILGWLKGTVEEDFDTPIMKRIHKMTEVVRRMSLLENS